MLTILGVLAEFERELIRVRTGDGRQRAKAAGVKFGRPLKLSEAQRHEALARLSAGEQSCDCSHLRCASRHDQSLSGLSENKKRGIPLFGLYRCFY